MMQFGLYATFSFFRCLIHQYTKLPSAKWIGRNCLAAVFRRCNKLADQITKSWILVSERGACAHAMSRYSPTRIYLDEFFALFTDTSSDCITPSGNKAQGDTFTGVP